MAETEGFGSAASYRFGWMLLKYNRCGCLSIVLTKIFPDLVNSLKINGLILYNFAKGGADMNRLKELRLAKGWSQAQLGKKLNCTDVTISRYETRQHGMDDEIIRKLCDIFDCSADYLLGRSPLMQLKLTPDEESIILAHRRADSRARELVALALEPFREDAHGARVV